MGTEGGDWARRGTIRGGEGRLGEERDDWEKMKVTHWLQERNVSTWFYFANVVGKNLVIYAPFLVLQYQTHKM